jgi:tetratricopeptide (TPR) repeat protein
MAHDVFVSYSSQDKPTADAIVASLEANGIRCWIAPRDILPGSDWSESIVEAMEQAGTMVLVFSAHSNTSPQIRREIESAVSAGIPVIPFRIEDVLPSKSLQYFIGPQHWLDAWTPPLEQHLHRLTATIKALLSKRIEGFDAVGKEPRLKPQIDNATGAPTLAAAEPPLAAAKAETPVEIAPSSSARIFSKTIPLILLASLVAAALAGGVVWWLTYQPAAPKISEKAREQARKEPVSPLKTPQAKGLSRQVDEQPGAPTKPPAEKLTAEDYFTKAQEAKDWQEKIVFYNKAIEFNPQYAEAYNNRGKAYYHEMTLSDYNKAIILNHKYAIAYYNRGNLYFDKKEYDKAFQDYDKAIELDPNLAAKQENSRVQTSKLTPKAVIFAETFPQKWMINYWESTIAHKKYYEGYLLIVNKIGESQYIGRINARSGNLKFNQDAIITVIGNNVKINCSNIFPRNLSTDNFYLKIKDNLMEGEVIDNKGRSGQAVFKKIEN